MAVLVNWIWSYLTYDRHARIIVAVEPQRRAASPQPAPSTPPPEAASADRPVVG
jgi:hypothetical protein